MKVVRACSVAFAVLGLYGCASIPASNEPLSFYGGTGAIDDPMNTNVLLPSPWVTKNDGGLFFPTTHRARLVASIDRKTRATTVVVDVEVDYQATAWRFYKSATYLTPDGSAERAQAYRRGRSDVHSCSPTCSYSESGLFAVKADMLAQLAASKRPLQVRVVSEVDARDIQFSAEQLGHFLTRLRERQELMTR